MDLHLTSPTNPRLKALVALRRRRARDEAGLTVVEGHEELALALAAGVAPQTLYVCPELYSPSGYAGSQAIGSQVEFVAAARAAGAEIVSVSRAAFEKVAYREGPDGLLGVLPAVDRPLSALRLPADPLVLLVEGVEKPGNLGAMLRTADAAGVDAVVAADPVTDWGNPNVIRASKGTVFVVPVATASTSTALEWLERRGVALVAATPHATLDYTDADLTAPVAIAVGAEDEGLSDRLLDAATVRVRVPMAGRVNSLNVSTTAAILLYEALRQRRSLG